MISHFFSSFLIFPQFCIYFTFYIYFIKFIFRLFFHLPIHDGIRRKAAPLCGFPHSSHRRCAANAVTLRMTPYRYKRCHATHDTLLQKNRRPHSPPAVYPSVSILNSSLVMPYIIAVRLLRKLLHSFLYLFPHIIQLISRCSNAHRQGRRNNGILIHAAFLIHTL